MEFKNLSSPLQASQSENLSPLLMNRNKKATMVIDTQAALEVTSQSSASTNLSTPAKKVSSVKAVHAEACISPSKRLMKLPYDTTYRAMKPIDAMMTDLTTSTSGAGSSIDMIEPLNLVAMSQLGEPDPTQISKHDLLSAMAFDRTGKILSVGDQGGRVICFELGRNEDGEEEYEYLTEFQSHTKSFDVLSSHEIRETVTAIEWINASSSAQPALLSSNPRSIKLFRIVNKKERKAESIKKKMAKGKGLGIPKTKVVGESKEGKEVATFQTGKEQHLHSLSLAPDMENFIAADESRINLWNLDRPKESSVYSLIDYNRQRATEDDELITSAKFGHQDTTFVYTTSKGRICVCDFRESSNF